MKALALALLAAMALAGCGGQAKTQARIAYIGADGYLYTARGDGTNAVLMTHDQFDDLKHPNSSRTEDWPTWSPDGKWIAFSRIRIVGGTMNSAGEYLVSGDGSQEATVTASDHFAPIYSSWSPDSRYLTVLVQEGEGFRLQLAQLSDGQPRVHPVDSGSPLFSAWSPDSGKLLLHVGGDTRVTARARLAEVNVATGGNPETLPMQPGNFGAPAWAPDGSEWAFSANAGDQDGLYLRRGAGSHLLATGDTIIFAWAPHDNRLAFTSRAKPSDDFYTGISMAGADGKISRIMDEPLLGFFWSPDGRRLAFVSPNHTAGLTLSTMSATGQDKHVLATFAPTEQFTQLVNFFDQYAQSHAIWSPDSTHLLFAGHRGGGQDAHVFSVAADGSSQPAQIADGSIAFWSR